MIAITEALSLALLPSSNGQAGLQIGGSLLFGVICAVLASGRGRSPLGWFFIGLFLSCIGLLILLLVPDLKADEAKGQHQRSKMRQLREQLKNERQTADERHSAHRMRLDAHDRALGIDTSEAELHQLGEGAPPLPLGASPAETMWHFSHGGESHGPVPTSRLRQLWGEGRIEPGALAWCQGMKDWRPIADLPELLADDDS